MTSKLNDLKRGNIIGLVKYESVTRTNDKGVTETSVLKTDELIPKIVDNIFYGTKNIRSAYDSANEIGSDYVFIRDEVGGRPCTVKEKLSDCFPIPITEEWLIRFGFEKVDNVNKESCPDWRFNGIEIMTNVNNCYVLGDWIGRIVFINYVHQLQNLCFSLTQTELA